MKYSAFFQFGRPWCKCRGALYPILAVALAFFASCGNDSGTNLEEHSYSDTLTDSRDGQTYRTVRIKTQLWMAENLNFETEDSYGLKNKRDNSNKYGRLYTWGAAMDSAGVFSKDGKGCGYAKMCTPTYPTRGICPEGWHLPSAEEFRILIEAVGDISAVKLRSKTGWEYYVGTDDFGFTMLPAGIQLDQYSYSDFSAYFWSSTEYGYYGSEGSFSGLYSAYSLQFNETAAWMDYNIGKSDAISVRCVYDQPLEYDYPKISSSSTTSSSSKISEEVEASIKDSRDGQTYKTAVIGNQIWMAENLNYESENSYCYNDSAKYCDKYGRLYTWTAAKNACPSGWHLPSEAEFNELLSSAGNLAFSELLAGNRSFDGNYRGEGSNTVFWSSTDNDSYDAITIVFKKSRYEPYLAYSAESYANSVRCIRD